jgi:predicted RNase H-like nuclease (RuvC/YqgF family)
VVDRVYKGGIPALRKTLEKLKMEFSELKSKTDWTKVRVEPLLRHALQLEQQLKSQGSSRLTKGVRMFHSDLVYLRENISGLEEILQSEKRSLRRKNKLTAKRGG